MLQNAPEFNSVGGGGFGGLGSGGFGAFGLIGLLGLDSLGRKRGDGDDNCAREAAVLAAISNSKDATVAEEMLEDFFEEKGIDPDSLM